jgi:hypothetical protein
MKADRLFYMGVVQKLKFLNNFLLHKVKEKRMKNAVKFFKTMQSIAIAALLTATALAVTTCNNGSTGGGNDSNTDGTSNGGAISGSTIVSGAPVKYDSSITNMDDAKARTDFSFVYGYGWDVENYQLLSTYINGSPSVKINDGKVTIKLGTPKPEFMFDAYEEFETVTVTPSDAKLFFCGDSFFWANDNKYALSCDKDYDIWTALVYTDKDVTIRGTETWTNTDDGTTGKDIYNVSLKRGWNYWIENETANNTTTTTASTTLPSGYYWTVFQYPYLR